MKQRIIAGAVLIFVVVGMLVFGGMVLDAALALVSFMATYEVAHAITRRGLQPIVFPAYLLALSFPFVYRFSGIGGMAAEYMACIILSVVVIVISRQMDAGRAMDTLVLYVYPLSLMTCLLLCHNAFERPVGLSAMVLALGAPSACDAFAYFGGTFFGKHKLAPQISPKKTIEGAAIGLFGGIFWGVVVYFLQRVWGGTVPLALVMTLGLVCAVLGPIGDLFASILKRWTEIKDFSSLIPGHGGMMDRLDSILICAPVILAAFYFFS